MLRQHREHPAVFHQPSLFFKLVLGKRVKMMSFTNHGRSGGSIDLRTAGRHFPVAA